MKKITTVLTTRDILKYNGKITKKACFTVSNNGDHIINIVNIQNLVSINKKAPNQMKILQINRVFFLGYTTLTPVVPHLIRS